MIRRPWAKLWAVSRMILRDEISTYPEAVVAFEGAFAAYLGRRYGVTYCNGTSSLDAALFALGVGPGDRVLVPAFTFHASISPVLHAGALPVFVDVDPRTSNMALDDFERKAGRGVKAAVVVHLWGNPVHMEAVCRIAAPHGLRLIEDCSHAHGAAWQGKKVGSFGEVGFFSLQAGKAVSAGEGGVAVCDDRLLYERMMLFGHFDRVAPEIQIARHRRYPRSGLGHKRRAHPLGIAMAHVDLKHLDAVNRRKRAIVREFAAHMREDRGTVVLFAEGDAQPGGFFNGVALRLSEPRAEEVVQALRKKGVPAKRCAYPPWHLEPFLCDPAYRAALTRGLAEDLAPPAAPARGDGGCPNMAGFAERLLFLPIDRAHLRRARTVLSGFRFVRRDGGM